MAMGQIPRSTECIFSFKKAAVYCICKENTNIGSIFEIIIL